VQNTSMQLNPASNYSKKSSQLNCSHQLFCMWHRPAVSKCQCLDCWFCLTAAKHGG
jgi:hypothetical protein